MATIFLSHRGSDAALAERLASELQSAGHRVWLDEWELHVGDSIVQQINRGIEGAAYVVMCYSSEGVLTPWMSREWMSGLAGQLNGRGVKVLPVRLSGGDPPAIWDDVKYADLVKDWQAGVADLLRAIR